ncbi:sialate O-acetylesterase [Geminisphaera colitermitum]|uniref:sialate O-acetylesterase n=1 Tax=Geminisphaera colitermitum TaxID=1148786 RepID=UPI000158CD7C|nr:sialate O-acetylesterase [Geminisphaera colitermitum]
MHSRFAAALVVSLALASATRADITLPALISEHAVLQKSPRVPIWGKAAPGETITLTLTPANVIARATTDPTGNWRITLNLDSPPPPPGPHTLTINGSASAAPLVINDILIGEVWLASGQSNMEFALKRTTDATQTIATSANARLRHFTVPKKTAAEPAPSDTLEGRWQIASPDTIADLTAIGYHFSRELQQQLDVPVGLIHASWGGTPIAPWTSADGLDRDTVNAAQTRLQREEARTFPQRIQDYARAYKQWADTTHRADPAPPPTRAPAILPPSDAPDWKPVTLPGLASTAGLPDAGVLWLTRTVTIPQKLAGLSLIVDLGHIEGFYTIYWNNEEVGRSTPRHGVAPYVRVIVGSAHVKAGDSTLAIRIFNPFGKLGLTGGPFRAGPLPLAGQWRALVENELPPLTVAQRASIPERPAQPPERRKTPAFLYNGMIAPLVPYALRGVIWYQGESDTSRAWQYRTALPLLIDDWRRQWDANDFPFLICQLANYGAKTQNPAVPAPYAELREAQTLATRTLPHTSQAVLIDLGEELDIHYRDKRPAAERLARVALAEIYQRRDIVASGPVYFKTDYLHSPPPPSTVGRLRLHFNNIAGGLVARPLPTTYRQRSTAGAPEIPLPRNAPAGSQLEGFAICGEDARWVWASARVDGNTVLVWSDDVVKPKYVRYAWADNPTCNLYNTAGLPAAPFRTDDFPLTTQKRR